MPGGWGTPRKFDVTSICPKCHPELHLPKTYTAEAFSALVVHLETAHPESV